MNLLPGSEFERLYLGEFVRGEGGDDLPQGHEGVVQGLRPLPLPYVGQHPLLLKLLIRLGGLAAVNRHALVDEGREVLRLLLLLHHLAHVCGGSLTGFLRRGARAVRATAALAGRLLVG